MIEVREPFGDGAQGLKERWELDPGNWSNALFPHQANIALEEKNSPSDANCLFLEKFVAHVKPASAGPIEIPGISGVFFEHF